MNMDMDFFFPETVLLESATGEEHYSVVRSDSDISITEQIVGEIDLDHLLFC
jgi:hypothetical protein